MSTNKGKPHITFDFTKYSSTEALVEALTETAFYALVVQDQSTRRFWHELSQYLRAKPLNEASPRRIVEICSHHVEIQPTKLSEMEARIGKGARDLCYRARYVMDPVWKTLDYFDATYYLTAEHAQMWKYIDRLYNVSANPALFYSAARRFQEANSVTDDEIYDWGLRVGWTRTGRHGNPRNRPALTR